MDIDALLAVLREPGLYPGSPAHVDLIQTHISVVALAGGSAFKFKKPVRLPFLDFSTLQARGHFCREEVRLNRRLCPDVYLGVVALVRSGSGFALQADAPGDGVVDWAVHMRRLPAERMLDRLIAQRAVSSAQIEALARQLAVFHAGADRGELVRRHGDPDRLAGFARDNFATLLALPGLDLPRPLLEALAARSARDFAALLPRLRQRAVRGHVVDGHGDLHCRNICMIESPVIYDCIEFEPAFRCGDVATEVAFLVMDLRYRGAAELAQVFARAYAAAANDPELPDLLPPLVQYRAVVRAKVAAIAAVEPELALSDRRGARTSALDHLILAAGTAIDADAPTWIVLCGPPASGKSVLAGHLQQKLGWPVIATDRVRKELLGLPAEARAGAGAYTAEMSARTYDEVLRRAAAATAGGSATVLLDGNFAEPALRAAAADAARRALARAVVLHVHVDAATAQRRLLARQGDPAAISDAGPQQFEALRRRFVAPVAAEGLKLATLDGGLELPELAAQAVTSVLSAG